MLQPDNKSDRMCHGQMPMTIPNETSSMCVYLIVLHAQSPKQTSNLNQIVNLHFESARVPSLAKKGLPANT